MNFDDIIYIYYLLLVMLFFCQCMFNYSVFCIIFVFNIIGDIKVNFIIKNLNGEM